MMNLEDIRSTMIKNEILTSDQVSKIKGGTANDDKRRPRPGGYTHIDCVKSK
jgi:hypothetical protein